MIRAEAAQKILQRVAQSVQQQVHSRIADVVTKCLHTIFPFKKPYEFQIKFDKKRGKTEARLVVLLDGIEIDPLDSEGGSVIDVAAFALRLAALILSKPQQRRLLLLDEPFKFVSSQNREKLGSLIEQLSKELKIQFVIVTHDPELEIGKVIRIGGDV